MKDKEYYQVVTEKFIESWQDLTKVSKPIIAAVNGYAVFAQLSLFDISLVEGVNWR